MSDQPVFRSARKTHDRDASSARSLEGAPTPVAEPTTEVSKPAEAAPADKEYVEILAEHQKATANEKIKVTMSLEPAVLNTLRDVKKLHRTPQGVAVDLAVKHLYKDLYEKNLKELKELGGA
ncbi:hypothetical protein ACTXM3_09365 [Glutamicibacter arilaitensis]|uniref:hypothetical protein n=1 Tax=Glutamicibacter arilaitensis TaxID=256701 RepID=UPI003FCFE271